jgi:hypothetical protein
VRKNKQKSLPSWRLDSNEGKTVRKLENPCMLNNKCKRKKKKKAVRGV